MGACGERSTAKQHRASEHYPNQNRSHDKPPSVGPWAPNATGETPAQAQTIPSELGNGRWRDILVERGGHEDNKASPCTAAERIVG